MFSFEQLLQWLHLENRWKIEQGEYRSLETDSRLVDAETVFIALPGVSSNGWDYLEQVAEKGCRVAIVPQGLGLHSDRMVLLEVAHIELVLAQLARQIYGPVPEHIVAVTGTNGKSSICYYIAQLAQALGLKSAMIGTFGIGVLGNLQDAKQTTPDLLTLHKLLSSFAQQGVALVAFEASSHALDQQRLAGVPVSTAVFSNLTRDHLDYHGSMENYACAKRRLFEFDALQRAIVCADSDYADFMVAHTQAPVWRYSALESQAADFAVLEKSFEQTGVRLTIQVLGQEFAVFLPLLGEFNVQNALAALAAVLSSVDEPARAVQALSSLQGAPGRMEACKRPEAPLVLVDYAHTSDALEVALKAIHAHASGRVICVFGCGGDRDTGKRPMMLAVAQQHADYVWLTSDNPRTESPQSIIKDALAALDDTLAEVRVEVDRHQAIAQAVAMARPEDIVLIAGKGHETYQEVNGVRHHFDDREDAREALKAYVAQA
ncbi:UDP-N-acetylmuramoyl-L-alanyl-D-glutamate--2, 6-diaminopimelate ligase [Marinomonas aquimarina]|uniref:UDP-N-acetylmuramoyl-L-alanyl-D-glutamate--2,6-diaminopimelate ligase n=1 Tax=Marinomonas aquimarina TaxID=295068 RepID=A0A1A8TKZ7_9GAMM|nr:UDP-N-acetylmuramoyl-L-alanyl-D-glutamate--2,6-diaminopimelate ligase [Marinomonas aquimarina]SBS33081.1 UDP-N-acetylmuramoyl-L-alanyl-D-glutamate--2, 6-diaminopimelate ligase [Marinomonas aquimarina]